MGRGGVERVGAGCNQNRLASIGDFENWINDKRRRVRRVRIGIKQVRLRILVLAQLGTPDAHHEHEMIINEQSGCSCCRCRLPMLNLRLFKLTNICKWPPAEVDNNQVDRLTEHS